ncbi:apolipoprotein N-acyltransferase [Massilia sp. B-10]|nr:apolipoprotein N-acyltransferase [Massilia sp. B-10]
MSGTPSASGTTLRVGLIQSNLAAYERQRQERGTHAVVREILDTHFAMSYDAVMRQHADAVLWSETAYPTTFGHPKSEAGADFDRQITDIVDAAGVPFVFGTYDSDSSGEYNAAAFVQPGTGLLGFYRKTRLFPLTEYLLGLARCACGTAPAAMERRLARQAMARVFPLKLRGGREIPVLPLICRDDTDASLAIAGARLGAQAILTMSNDSWFTADPLGAQLHQAVAAFRSIETRLPQFRVTTNGYSAVIDARGTVLAGTRMGERTLVIADVAARTPAPTLMVLWGDWVGRAASAFLVILAAWSLAPSVRRHYYHGGAARRRADARAARRRAATGSPHRRRPVADRGTGLGLLWMLLALLSNDALRTNTLAQMRLFAALFLAPEVAAWCVLLLFSARATLENGTLVLTRGASRIAFAPAEIAALRFWSLPLPCPGLSLQLASGPQLALRTGAGRSHAAGGGPGGGRRRPRLRRARVRAVMQTYVQAALATRRSRLDHPLAKYLLLPLALATPAFHLHQQIAYGGPFGEYYAYGLQAYLAAFALWWAAWSIGVVLSEALLRAAINTATLLAALLRPATTPVVRAGLERAGHAALFWDCLSLAVPDGLRRIAPASWLLTVLGRE